MDHHAYYIEAPLSTFEAYKAHLHPMYAKEHERFGIEEARALITLASLKNFASLKNYDSAVFLLGIASLTSEAQQAMLKLFEEPQEGTQFVLLMPHGTLLATLRSRMLEYAEKLDEFVDTKDAKKFLSLAGKDRSDFITKLLKDDEGTKERVRDFINALEAQLHTKIGEPKTRQALEDIAMVRGYLQDRSPSLKMLLEHLAVAL